MTAVSGAAARVRVLEERSFRSWGPAARPEGETEALNQFATALGNSLARAITEAFHAFRASYAEESQALANRVDDLAVSLVALREEGERRDAAIVSEITPKVTALVDRLDRQAEVIRVLCEGQAAGDTALSRFIDVLTGLKSSSVPLPRLPEGGL